LTCTTMKVFPGFGCVNSSPASFFTETSVVSTSLMVIVSPTFTTLGGACVGAGVLSVNGVVSCSVAVGGALLVGCGVFSLLNTALITMSATMPPIIHSHRRRLRFGGG